MDKSDLGVIIVIVVVGLIISGVIATHPALDRPAKMQTDVEITPRQSGLGANLVMDSTLLPSAGIDQGGKLRLIRVDEAGRVILSPHAE